MLSGRRLYTLAVLFCSFLAFGMVANPWIVAPDRMHDSVGEGILTALGLIGIVWWLGVAGAAVRRARDHVVSDQAPATPNTDRSRSWSRWLTAMTFIYILGLWILLFSDRLRYPRLINDDYHYIAIAQSWKTTAENLFTPYCEHLCVVTRLITYAICSLASSELLPLTFAAAGMVLFAAAVVLLYLFVRRECGSPSLGLLAVALFAITTVHREVIEWYSANQWCWALVVLLLSLLVLQGGVSGNVWRLVASSVLAAVAPLNYSVGLLVGPVCTVYVATRRSWSMTRPFAVCLVPSLGTIVFLALFVPLKGPGIVARASYGGRPPQEAVAPLRGVLYGVRSTVDQLVLRNLGVYRAERLPRVCYAAAFPVLLIAASELVIRSKQPSLLVVGPAIVLMAYGMTLPFRAWMEYEDFMTWTRYQLFPQVGVALFVCSTLADAGPKWLRNEALTPHSAALLAVVATMLFWIHAAAT